DEVRFIAAVEADCAPFREPSDWSSAQPSPWASSISSLPCQENATASVSVSPRAKIWPVTQAKGELARAVALDEDEGGLHHIGIVGRVGGGNQWRLSEIGFIPPAPPRGVPTGDKLAFDCQHRHLLVFFGKNSRLGDLDSSRQPGQCSTPLLHADLHKGVNPRD